MYCWLVALLLLPAVPVGGVSARGGFLLDGFLTWWQGSAFEGASVEASRVTVRVWTRSGSRWELAAGSKGKVRAGWFELERGAVLAVGTTAVGVARVEGAGYRVDVTAGAKPVITFAGAAPRVAPADCCELRKSDRVPPLEGIPEELRPLSQRP